MSAEFVLILVEFVLIQAGLVLMLDIYVEKTSMLMLILASLAYLIVLLVEVMSVSIILLKFVLMDADQ